MRGRLALFVVAILLPALLGAAHADEIPLQKECVGTPPRQTEDPLSPPCNPYWFGDNGEETSPGVTGTEIRVVLYNDIGIWGDMNAPYRSEDDPRSVDYERRNLVLTIKTLLKFMQRRFQTFGRVVHVIALASSGRDEVHRRLDAVVTRNRFDPFAVVTLGERMDPYVARLAELGVMSFGATPDLRATELEVLAPYVWSFLPDQSTEAAWSASFICRELLGRSGDDQTTRLPARLSPDPVLRSWDRKLALIFGVRSRRGAQQEQLAHELWDGVRSQCGYDFDQVISFRADSLASGWFEALGIMAELKLRGVTTLVCYCYSDPPELTVQVMQSAATALGYLPEWYWDHASGMDRPMWEQVFGSPLQSSFGTTYLWRSPAFTEQLSYRAFKSEIRSDAKPNARFLFDVYHTLMNLFTAVQLAGAFITPPAVESGLLGFERRNLADPYLPSGGYGAGGAGPRSFVDSAMAWWWDPFGRAPGDRLTKGCIRVADEGRRVNDGDWPVGDGDLFDPAAPCTAPQQKLYERL